MNKLIVIERKSELFFFINLHQYKQVANGGKIWANTSIYFDLFEKLPGKSFLLAFGCIPSILVSCIVRSSTLKSFFHDKG